MTITISLTLSDLQNLSSALSTEKLEINNWIKYHNNLDNEGAMGDIAVENLITRLSGINDLERRVNAQWDNIARTMAAWND